MTNANDPPKMIVARSITRWVFVWVQTLNCLMILTVCVFKGLTSQMHANCFCVCECWALRDWLQHQLCVMVASGGNESGVNWKWLVFFLNILYRGIEDWHWFGILGFQRLAYKIQMPEGILWSLVEVGLPWTGTQCVYLWKWSHHADHFFFWKR